MGLALQEQASLFTKLAFLSFQRRQKRRASGLRGGLSQGIVYTLRTGCGGCSLYSAALEAFNDAGVRFDSSKEGFLALLRDCNAPPIEPLDSPFPADFP